MKLKFLHIILENSPLKLLCLESSFCFSKANHGGVSNITIRTNIMYRLIGSVEEHARLVCVRYQ